MSENKIFKLTKCVQEDVLFTLHPISNPELKKTIYLTHRNPIVNLPLDWALGIFLDNVLYEMYKKGYFTFSNNDELVKAAIDAGVYFDEVLDFTPAKISDVQDILNILKKGVRNEILDTIKKYGREKVEGVVTKNLGSLTNSVINMLENLWNIQLIIDGDR